MNYQGGKQYGLKLKQVEQQLDSIAAEFASEASDSDLEKYKRMFMTIDVDASLDIDQYELSLLMEKIGQAKTHLELKKMIEQVDSTKKGAINYRDFLSMMLGKKSSILQKILMFEAMNKKEETPVGKPVKKSIADLP